MNSLLIVFILFQRVSYAALDQGIAYVLPHTLLLCYFHVSTNFVFTHNYHLTWKTMIVTLTCDLILD